MGELFTNAITTLLSGLGSGIVSVITTLTGIFYTPGEAGAVGDLTFLGNAALIGFVVSIITFALNKVISFVRVRGR